MKRRKAPFAGNEPRRTKADHNPPPEIESDDVDKALIAGLSKEAIVTLKKDANARFEKLGWVRAELLARVGMKMIGLVDTAGNPKLSAPADCLDDTLRRAAERGERLIPVEAWVCQCASSQKELIEQVAKETGFSKSEVRREAETLCKKGTGFAEAWLALKKGHGGRPIMSKG